MKKLLILGIGNLVLKDEGIGIHIINRLEKAQLPPWVDLLDGGTGGIFLIDTIQQYEHLILIDATLDNLPVGTVRLLKPKYSCDYPLLLSAHEIGLKEMIEAMIIQEKIPEIDLVAISVEEINEIGMQLSPKIEKEIPKIINNIYQLIERIKFEDDHLSWKNETRQHVS